MGMFWTGLAFGVVVAYFFMRPKNNVVMTRAEPPKVEPPKTVREFLEENLK